MAPQTDLSGLIARTARRMTQLQKGSMQEICGIGIIDFELWEWPQGVGVYGLYRYYRQTVDAVVRREVVDWFDRRRAAGLPAKNINTTAPMLTLAHLAGETRSSADLALCAEWAEWIMRDLPRTTEGGFQHVTTDFAHEQQLWSDTLFMTVLFLAKVGVLLERPAYVEEAAHQFLLHIHYLSDRKSGLWFHGWDFRGRHNFAGAHWARGNCWFTAATVDFLEMLELPGMVRRHLANVLAAQVTALSELQTSDGMWHTLLDDPTSYVEASGTAGIAYGILKGVRLGMLDRRFTPIGLRAANAVISRIGSDGTVGDVSYGTPMGADLDHYRRIPKCPMAYGQALAVLLLTEVLQLPK